MKPKLLLRIAAIIILLHAVGHTIGVYTWNSSKSHVPQELIKQMTDQHFSFQGVDATIAKFYEGFGYASTLMLLLVVFLLWIVADLSGKNASFSAKILLPILFFLISLVILEWIYFFPMAAAFSFVAAVLTGISYFRLSKTNA